MNTFGINESQPVPVVDPILRKGPGNEQNDLESSKINARRCTKVATIA